MDVDMIVSSFGKRLDFLDMLGRVGPTHEHLCNVIFMYQLRRLGKIRWRGQFLGQFTFEAGVRPVPIRCMAGAGLVLGPAHGQLSIAWLASAPSGLEILEDAFLR